MGAPAADGNYPIPKVKKVSYPLFLITFLAGIILSFVAVGILWPTPPRQPRKWKTTEPPNLPLKLLKISKNLMPNNRLRQMNKRKK